MSTDHALIATGLHKRFGTTQALDGFDLEVRTGHIHGLLGPNGAGKSTAVKIFTTLSRADDGTATVAGFDVKRQGSQVRSRIGLVGQHPALDEILGGRQNLVMFGQLAGLNRQRARERADALLEQFRLSEAADRSVGSYSGGMRRRLDIAAGLILTPEVLFLDEPTTGLDPRARGEVWDTVREIAAAGTTVLLTTQYLDEADRLADRISIMNAGRVIAEGSPDSLKRSLGADRVVLSLADGPDFERARGAFPDAIADEATQTLTMDAATGVTTLVQAVRTLDTLQLQAEDLLLRRPTLDEVFLALTEQADGRAPGTGTETPR